MKGQLTLQLGVNSLRNRTNWWHYGLRYEAGDEIGHLGDVVFLCAGEGTDILPTHGVMDGYIESYGSYSVASDGPSSRATDGSASLAPEYTEWIRVRENIQVCVRGRCRTSSGLGWRCIFSSCSRLLDINIPHTKYYGGVHATPPLASMYEDRCKMVNATR